MTRRSTATGVTAALALAASLVGLAARAEGPAPGAPAGTSRGVAAGELEVTRADALRLGASRSHVVAEARAPRGALPELERAAGAPLSYSPRLAVYAGARRGTFGAGLEVGAAATQDLSLHGLGEARADAAAITRRAGLAAYERARLEGAAAAALAWVDLAEAQELVRLRGKVREDAEALARLARARVARGVGLPHEAALAQADVGAAELAELDAEGQLATARAELCFALALAPSVRVHASGTLAAADDEPVEARVAEQHPALALARAQVAASRAEAALARAQASPALGVGVAYARDGTGEQALTGTLSVPLPFLDPTRFDAARHRMELLSAEAREVRARAELGRAVALAQHERGHAREVRAALRDRVVAPLQEAVRLARAAYEAGVQDATPLLVARPRLLAAEEQLVRAAADVERADLRYAAAQGSLVPRER